MAANHNSGKVIIKAASACVWRGDEILLVQRPGGRWAFPGGKLNLAETALAAAHRELLEETGVIADLHAEVGVFNVETRDAGYEITCFTGFWLRGDASAQSDAKAVHWQRFDDLSALPLAPNIRSAVKLARKLTSL
jgi:8-oxo-dGTP diphosphatase